MPVETIGSWRELDDAVAARGGGGAHAPWVFRGLARSSYSNVSSLARLGDDFPSLERHLIRNVRKYAHREPPGPTLWDHFATATSPEHEAIVWAVDCEAAHAELPAELRAALQAEGAADVHHRAAGRSRPEPGRARPPRRPRAVRALLRAAVAR